MSASIRANSAMGLLKSVLAPRLYDTAPPNLYHQSSYSKRIDYSLVVAVGPDNSLVDVRVPTQSGMVLWQPSRGASSCVRMGFIPNNASVSVSTNTHGFVCPKIIANSSNYSAAIQIQMTQLFFNGPLAVPYNNLNNNDQITVNPILAQNFSTARVYNGDLRLICDTVPIGNTALNGYFAAGSVSDTRDVSQITTSAGTVNCFAPVDLVQNSVTTKEGLKEIGAMKGIMSLVGSDIPPFYTNPNADLTDAFGAQFTSLYVPTFSSFPTTGSTAIGPGAGYILSSTWITPWATSTGTSGTLGVVYASTLNGPAIDEFGTYDIEYRFTFQGLETPSGNLAASGHLQCQFWHYYATCSSDGSVTWAIDKDDQYVQDLLVIWGSGQSQYGQKNYTLRSSSRLYTTGYATSGKYIGTIVQLAFVWDYIGGNTNTDVLFGLVQTTAVDGQMTPSLSVRSRSVNERGWAGPARILRWDGMANGQNIRVDGVVHAQCIPNGLTMPFVQTMGARSDAAVDLNTLPWLAELFNGESPLRRNWPLDEYLLYLQREMPALTPATIARWSEDMNSMTLAGTSDSAGVLDAIKDAKRQADVEDVEGQYGMPLAKRPRLQE